MKFNGRKYLASSRRFLKDIQKEAMRTTEDDPDNQIEYLKNQILNRKAHLIRVFKMAYNDGYDEANKRKKNI